MSGSATLTLNGTPVQARLGETLVDAALGGAILVPHDCQSGQCGSCRVDVLAGAVDACGTQEGRSVLACQARVAGDATIGFDVLPEPVKRAGALAAIAVLSPDVIEIRVRLRAPLEYRPGQYVRVKFSGFPAREYSPTYRMDGTSSPDELVFHVSRIARGIVSAEFGRAIAQGHPVTVQGPFGSAYLRDAEGPLVLVSGGAGWAPIWSLARAARAQQRARELVVIAGSREVENLYMRRALDWLAADGATDVIGTAEQGAAAGVRVGRPTAYLPALGARHTVYVAGPPGLVDAVKASTRRAHSTCYADPFVPSARAPSLMDRLTRRWAGMRREPARRTAWMPQSSVRTTGTAP